MSLRKPENNLRYFDAQMLSTFNFEAGSLLDASLRPGDG